MISALLVLGLIASIIWGLFQPYAAALAFIIFFVVIFEGWLLLLLLAGKPGHIETFAPPHFFNPDETAVLRKYHLLFKFPFASRHFSSSLSLLGLTSFIWVPWLLYQGHWVLAIVIGLNYFVVGPLSMRLNPRVFLQGAARSPVNLWAMEELHAIDSAFEKLLQRRRSAAPSESSPHE